MKLTKENVRAIIFYNYKRGLTGKECFEEIKAAFGDENKIPASQTIYAWYSEFKFGRACLSNAYGGGRRKTAVTPENINAVRILIQEDRNITYDQIQAALGIGTSAIQKILHEELHVKKLDSCIESPAKDVPEPQAANAKHVHGESEVIEDEMEENVLIDVDSRPRAKRMRPDVEDTEIPTPSVFQRTRSKDCKGMKEDPKSIESATAKVFLHANIPFEFADSDQWKQFIKILNHSYAAKMPNARELERKFGGGNCLVCLSSFSGKQKSIRSFVGSNKLPLHDVLETWTGKYFSEEEKDSLAICIACFSNVEKFYEHQESCKEIQSKMVINFTQNQCEQVFIKQEREVDSGFVDFLNVPNTTAVWATATDTAPGPDSENESEDKESNSHKRHKRASLAKHKKTQQITVDKLLRCGTCKKVCLTEARLEFHELTDHEKQTSAFQCPVCLESDMWEDISDFRRHFLDHKESNSILCTICGASLKKGSFKQHMQMHDNIRPFVCEYPDCNKAFRDADKRKMHHISHTSEKNYSCPHCPEKRYAHKKDMDIHMMKHHGAKKAVLIYKQCS